MANVECGRCHAPMQKLYQTHDGDALSTGRPVHVFYCPECGGQVGLQSDKDQAPEPPPLIPEGVRPDRDVWLEGGGVKPTDNLDARALHGAIMGDPNAGLPQGLARHSSESLEATKRQAAQIMARIEAQRRQQQVRRPAPQQRRVVW